MAQMLTGEPRSVPDPDSEPYNEMIRNERLKRAMAEDGFQPGLDHFSPNSPPIGVPLPASVPRTPQDALFCTDPSAIPPDELAGRQRAIERASFMASSPLAGAAYGVASLANASPQARDQALAAGAALDTVMMGAAPFGLRVCSRPTPPASGVGPVGWQRPAIRYGDLDADGQVTGVSATITGPMLNTGTRANWRRTPPGWQGDGDKYNEARAHLYGRQLGGSGEDPRNLATMTQIGANTPQMSSFENEVARRVRAGEVVDYFSKPLYQSGVLPPSAVLVSATGSRQRPAAKLVLNPAATRR